MSNFGIGKQQLHVSTKVGKMHLFIYKPFGQTRTVLVFQGPTIEFNLLQKNLAQFVRRIFFHRESPNEPRRQALIHFEKGFFDVRLVSGDDDHEIVFVIAQRLAQCINAFFGITITSSTTFYASATYTTTISTT